MLHATYINEVTAVAYKGQGALPRQFQSSLGREVSRKAHPVFSSPRNKAGPTGNTLLSIAVSQVAGPSCLT